MTRAEIRGKFDGIVAFAEVEKFIDTPVKRYSSGMYVRLAFAVAAHLEPEILVVDEVLAVGDSEFQKKCLGKMSEVARGGRTVLFVTHNMAAIKHLCERTVLLVAGKIGFVGEPQAAISHYLSDANDKPWLNLEHWADRVTNGEAHITELHLNNQNESTSLLFGDDLRIRIFARFNSPLTNPVFGVVIHDATGVPVSNIQSIHSGLVTGVISDEIVVEATLEKLSLYPGRYLLSPWITDSAMRYDIDFPRMCAALEIQAAPGPYGDLKLHEGWGKVFIPSQWKVICS
jgi:lipopolysaccharide transport system ATP-binding protein